jgi:hypothetical protein
MATLLQQPHPRLRTLTAAFLFQRERQGQIHKVAAPPKIRARKYRVPAVQSPPPVLRHGRIELPIADLFQQL